MSDYSAKIVKGLAGNVIGCEYKAESPHGKRTLFQECYKCTHPDERPVGCPKTKQLDFFLYWGA